MGEAIHTELLKKLVLKTNLVDIYNCILFHASCREDTFMTLCMEYIKKYQQSVAH
jgi:hypothetical protein